MNDLTLRDMNPDASVKQPLLLRIFAQLVSVIFHPLFIPLYLSLFLLFVHPFLFAGYDLRSKIRLLITVFFNLTFFPAITVLLSLALKFISSIKLNTQKDRIIPLAATMIFYFWCWFVLKNFPELPPLFRQFVFGSFLTIIGAWIANIYFKVSLHGLAMGGAVFFMFLLLYLTDGGSAQYFATTILIAGIVCTCRLLLNAHLPFELWAGVFIGAFCQAAAYWI